MTPERVRQEKGKLMVKIKAAAEEPIAETVEIDNVIEADTICQHLKISDRTFQRIRQRPGGPKFPRPFMVSPGVARWFAADYAKWLRQVMRKRGDD